MTVIGQAGIGKSRLAWEFEKYLDGVVDTAYWHEGRSPSYGEGISYWALAEMVRRRAGIAEGDDDTTIRRRLGATLDEFILDPAERRWIEPPLAGLLGLAELPTEGREELFAAWRTFFERMAAVAPVVMVFSDVQWADQGLLDFVEDLLHWARNAPIFVVASARPELLERRAGFGDRLRSVTRISLEPLGDEPCGSCSRASCPACRLPPCARWCSAPRGSRSTRSRRCGCSSTARCSSRRTAATQLTGDLEGLGVADTLQALIASRLDANRPEDRALLLDASVLGQSFTVEALAAVAGVQPAELSRSARPPGAPRAAVGGGGPPLAGARPVHVRPGPRARGRLPEPRQAPIVASGTWPRRATSRGSAAMSCPASWLRTTWPPTRHRAPARRPMRSPPRRASP